MFNKLTYLLTYLLLKTVLSCRVYETLPYSATAAPTQIYLLTYLIRKLFTSFLEKKNRSRLWTLGILQTKSGPSQSADYKINADFSPLTAHMCTVTDWMMSSKTAHTRGTQHTAVGTSTNLDVLRGSKDCDFDSVQYLMRYRITYPSCSLCSGRETYCCGGICRDPRTSSIIIVNNTIPPVSIAVRFSPVFLSFCHSNPHMHTAMWNVHETFMKKTDEAAVLVRYVSWRRAAYWKSISQSASQSINFCRNGNETVRKRQPQLETLILSSIWPRKEPPLRFRLA